MTLQQIILYVFGGLGSIGILGGGLGVLINQLRKAPREEKKDVMDSANSIMEFWKNQAEQLKVINDTKDKEYNDRISVVTKEFTDKINILSKEVGTLTGRLDAAEKAKAEYLEILQDKDNSSQEFRKFMVDSMKNQLETHQKMVAVLNDIHGMTKAEHDRDFTVNATVTKN